ncbi:MAG: substrate-binding domain-containing protein [Proteobacteria bacterium]|nr:substrate-binding domain-containing protein [Pseudomonadota bacterium]
MLAPPHLDRPVATLASLAVLLVGLWSGCTAAGEPQGQMRLVVAGEPAPRPGNADADRRVGLIVPTLTNPLYADMARGARRAAIELGVPLSVGDAANEAYVAGQLAFVEQFTRARVAAMVIAPASSRALVPALERARRAGVVVVQVANRLAGGKPGSDDSDIPFVGGDDEHGAYLAAKLLADRLGKRTTQVAMIDGMSGTHSADQRAKGALRAFSENPKLTVVTRAAADWKIDEAFAVAGRIFTRHPNVGAIFCASDMMALGAIEYLKQSGRKRVLVASSGGMMEEARAAIAAGTLLATVDHKADVVGYKGVQLALRGLNGQALSADKVVDVELITAETVKPKER